MLVLVVGVIILVVAVAVVCVVIVVRASRRPVFVCEICRTQLCPDCFRCHVWSCTRYKECGQYCRR
jgi:hypothetical protein